MSTALGTKKGFVPRFEHVYVSFTADSVSRELVQPGWPHGDAWGAIINPTKPRSHDAERHAALLAEKAKKKGNQR